MDPNDAMVILGHSRIAVTLGIYTHGDEDSRRDSLTRLDQLLSQARRRAATGQPGTTVAVTSAVTTTEFRGLIVILTWVGLRGLEPRASSLSGKRSNRLSYSPSVAALPAGRDLWPGWSVPTGKVTASVTVAS